MGYLLVETRQFTRRVTEQLSDEEYRALQLELAARPEAGVVIPGSGGLRKLRWGAGGSGKRGGVRVIYLYRKTSRRIYLVDLFAKNERADLTPRELKLLRQALEGDAE
jgi:hypothetical protein